MSEVAEALLESEDYKCYVSYDKCAVLRAVENTTTDHDDLQCGANVTGNLLLKNIHHKNIL